MILRESTSLPRWVGYLMLVSDLVMGEVILVGVD
jgi:hypothetical protein